MNEIPNIPSPVDLPPVVATPQTPVSPEFTEKVIGEVIPTKSSPKRNISNKVIYLLLILAIVVAGAIAFFLYTSNKAAVAPIKKTEETTRPKTLSPTLTPTPTVFPEQSNSDEISAIETDLENTDFSNVDQGLVAIENEI